MAIHILQFIVCVLQADGPDEQSSLVFVDQHAADERVQLERLQRGCLQRVRGTAAAAVLGGGGGGGGSGQIQSQSVAYGNFDVVLGHFSALHHPKRAVCCTLRSAHAYRMLAGWCLKSDVCPNHVFRYQFDLRPTEAALLVHFRQKMRWFGLRFTVVGTTVKVTQAPGVLVGFGPSKVKVGIPGRARAFVLFLSCFDSGVNLACFCAGVHHCCIFTLQALITEQLELLHGTAGGGGRTIPKVMMDVLKSQACRNAYMFGDALTADQCTALLKALSETDLPFQCTDTTHLCRHLAARLAVSALISAKLIRPLWASAMPPSLPPFIMLQCPPPCISLRLLLHADTLGRLWCMQLWSLGAHGRPTMAPLCTLPTAPAFG